MREQNTEYILSLSYGKDSLACLGAIQHLGWPLDRIVTADVWELLLKWDIDSPVTFKPGRGGKPGKTVHDYERRFKLEDDGVLTPGDARFRWSKIDEPIQLSLF